MSPEGSVLTAVVGVLTVVMAWLGIRDQNRTAKAGSDTVAQSAQTDAALHAWGELLDPYREEVKNLRAEVAALRGREQERDRKIQVLTDELHRWQSVAKTLARWGITMRDQLRGLGHEVPAEPDELVALRIVSDVDNLNNP